MPKVCSAPTFQPVDASVHPEQNDRVLLRLLDQHPEKLCGTRGIG
jgi:hypothetical protein